MWKKFVCPQCGKTFEVGQSRPEGRPCRICQAENKRLRQTYARSGSDTPVPEFNFLAILGWLLRVLALVAFFSGAVLTIGGHRFSSFLGGLTLGLMILVVSELCLTLRNMAINVARIRRELVDGESESGDWPEVGSSMEGDSGVDHETE